MNRIEAWEHFLEQGVLPHRTEQIKALHHYFCVQKNKIAEQIVAFFDRFCEEVRQLQTAGTMKKCANIHMSLLRTSLLEGHPVYMLEAVDMESLGKIGVTPFRYDAGWIYSFLDNWDRLCEENRRGYMDQINRPAFEAWKNEQLYPFHAYMVHALRYAMDAVRELSSFQNIDKEAYFDIRVGEYRDNEVSESVYRRNVRTKPSITCKGWLENRLEHEYIHEHIGRVDLSYGFYEGINLNYARFEDVSLTGSNIQNSLLLGTRFEQCQCDQVNFGGSVLYDADFRGCNLEQARFDGVLGERDSMNEKHGMFFGIHGVRFQGANLKNASFRDARIAGDFTYAELEGIDFTRSELTGSRMLQRDVFKVSLTEEQRQAICWVEE